MKIFFRLSPDEASFERIVVRSNEYLFVRIRIILRLTKVVCIWTVFRTKIIIVWKKNFLFERRLFPFFSRRSILKLIFVVFLIRDHYVTEIQVFKHSNCYFDTSVIASSGLLTWQSLTFKTLRPTETKFIHELPTSTPSFFTQLSAWDTLGRAGTVIKAPAEMGIGIINKRVIPLEGLDSYEWCTNISWVKCIVDA